MKIAVPTKENYVSDHFGHCDAYTIFSVNETGKIVDAELLPGVEGCGCKSNIAAVLKDKGVNVMLAGNMGQGAFINLSNAGIRVYRGCGGDVMKLAEAYIQGAIEDSGEGCDHHHEEGHQCSH